MGDDWTIRAEGLSKKFGLSLKRSMQYGLTDSLKQLAGMRVDGKQLREGEFWAVDDVSFELHRGESLGIMGVNGSGKSTLLRVLTGVYRPDVGKVALRGNIGSLIAAGAGFAPMLTGRENIHVNGALLGMSRETIKKSIDEIIAFAELEGFLDMPVKNYSSGMIVRLGFAIAAMSEPEILIVDEVLAVGDVNFQKKCYDYLFGLRRSGTTIVLVSHSVGAIWAVCESALLMDKGAVVVAGGAEDVIREYENINARNALRSAEKLEQLEHHAAPRNNGHEIGVRCNNIKITRADLTPTSEFEMGEDIVFTGEIESEDPIDDFILRFVLDAAHYRNICTIDSYENGFEIERLEPGNRHFSVRLKDPKFRPGFYSLNVAVVSKNAGLHLFLAHRVMSFVVTSPKDRFLYSDPTAVIHVDADFKIDSWRN